MELGALSHILLVFFILGFDNFINKQNAFFLSKPSEFKCVNGAFNKYNINNYFICNVFILLSTCLQKTDFFSHYNLKF